MPTPITPIRLTEDDHALIRDLRQRFREPSVSAMVRRALRFMHEVTFQAPEKNPKKSRKRA